MRYVLDCSVAVRWFVPQTYWQVAARVFQQFRSNEITFVAPEVVVPEFGHVLRKLVVGKKATAERARDFLPFFLALPIERVANQDLAPRALDLAFAHSATFYDALYLALAEREGLQVLTVDGPMTRAFVKLDRTLHLADYPVS